eukprot:10088-Heterococcus_DN1.PRE.4
MVWLLLHAVRRAQPLAALLRQRAPVQLQPCAALSGLRLMSENYAKALETRSRKPSKQQAESIARSREIEKIEHAMLRTPPRNATTSMRDTDACDDALPPKKQRVRAKRDGPSRTQLDQARRLRHRVERLQRKRQWRKVVSEVTRARTEGVPLIESAQTLVLESYARDGRWREAIATLHEAHVKEFAALQHFVFLIYTVIACARCITVYMFTNRMNV